LHGGSLPPDVHGSGRPVTREKSLEKRRKGLRSFALVPGSHAAHVTGWGLVLLIAPPAGRCSDRETAPASQPYDADPHPAPWDRLCRAAVVLVRGCRPEALDLAKESYLASRRDCRAVDARRLLQPGSGGLAGVLFSRS